MPEEVILVLLDKRAYDATIKALNKINIDESLKASKAILRELLKILGGDEALIYEGEPTRIIDYVEKLNIKKIKKEEIDFIYSRYAAGLQKMLSPLEPHINAIKKQYKISLEKDFILELIILGRLAYLVSGSQRIKDLTMIAYALHLLDASNKPSSKKIKKIIYIIYSLIQIITLWKLDRDSPQDRRVPMALLGWALRDEISIKPSIESLDAWADAFELDYLYEVMNLVDGRLLAAWDFNKYLQ